jgi:plastocyanin
MTRIRFFIGFGIMAFAMPQAASAQHPGPAISVPHRIVVKLVERSELPRFAFEPSTFTAERGDTLEFVQFAESMHNVHFIKTPVGANLGRAAVSRYLTTKGQTYSIVIDRRFVGGTYEIVCDPHSMMGMHAFLTVSSEAIGKDAGK